MFISEITNTYIAITRSLIYVMELLMIFKIKIYRKLPVF